MIGFAQGIADILNQLPTATTGTVKSSVSGEMSLDDAKAALDSQGYKLMMEEIDYDEKCLQAFRNNMKSFELRRLHQKDSMDQEEVGPCTGRCQCVVGLKSALEAPSVKLATSASNYPPL